jgi:PAS domain S-box-containing protein
MFEEHMSDVPKQAEEMIRNLALFPEENPSPVLRIDKSGVLLYANRASDELLSQWQSSIGGLVPSFIMNELTIALKIGVIRDFETSCGERVFSFAMVPIIERGYVNFYGRDITQKNQIEKALKETELCYRTIGEAIEYGTWKTDASGECTYVSDSFLELTGMTLPELQQYGWLHLLAPEQREPTKEHWLHCVETGADFQREHQFFFKDGKTRFVLAIGRPVRNPEGEIICWVGINLDITERKQREAQTERLNTVLEDKNRELNAFNYAIAHDLRNPISIITGYCDVIRSLYSDQLDKQFLEYFSQIENGVLRLNKTIAVLLKFARQTYYEPQRNTVYLSAIAKEIANNLQLHEPLRTVIFMIADEITTIGDEKLLRLVLDNLLSNAWKFTSRRKDAVIEFGMNENDGLEVFFVRDNGVGFDMRDEEKLYLPFQRLNNAEEFAGDGIGLSTAKRIIHRHGGTIWAEGELNQGATFYFTICKT